MNFWEDKYRVEEDGSVYNIKTGRKRKAVLNNRGYLTIGLYNNGKEIKMTIHRLVALTYIQNPDNKPQVDHIDRNKLNNHFTNLRWVTNLENSWNTKIGKSGERCINFCPKRGYNIKIMRNKYRYVIHLGLYCTKEEAIAQRDLMLSMF